MGLHPASATLLESLVGMESEDTQVILATQSPTSLYHFGPEDFLVADRVNGGFDPRRDTVTLPELRDGQYAGRVVLTVGDTLTTPLLPCLVIPLAGVFRHPRRPGR